MVCRYHLFVVLSLWSAITCHLSVITPSLPFCAITLNTDTSIHDACQLPGGKLLMISYGSGKIYSTDCKKLQPELLAVLDSVYYEKIFFTTGTTGWIAGEGSRLLQTTNSGITWTKKIFDSTEISHLIYSMTWPGKDTGYIGTSNKSKPFRENYLFRTYNGGQNWVKLQAPDLFFDIVRLRASTLIATGNNKIFLSANSGSDWKEIYNDTSRKTGQIRDIELLNDEIWMAVSFSGKLIFTNNGGNNWTSIALSGARLRSIASHNNKIVITGDKNTDNNNTWISANNGKTWKGLLTGLSDLHKVIWCNNNFIAGGKDGMHFINQ